MATKRTMDTNDPPLTPFDISTPLPKLADFVAQHSYPDIVLKTEKEIIQKFTDSLKHIQGNVTASNVVFDEDFIIKITPQVNSATEQESFRDGMKVISIAMIKMVLFAAILKTDLFSSQPNETESNLTQLAAQFIRK